MTGRDGDTKGRGVASARVLVPALTVTMVSTFPPFLAGALAVEIAPELGFDEASLGAAVSGFFVVSAIGSLSFGGIADRWGWPTAMRLGALFSAFAMFGVALFAHSWVSFAIPIALGGLTMAVGNPAVNLALSQGVAPERQGLAFGLKHSAVPVAGLLSGLALPLFALTVGWRAVFVGAGVIATLVAVAVPKSAPKAVAGTPVVTGLNVALEMRPLVAMAIGAAFAASIASALSAFLVISVVASGVSPAGGGWILAAASATGLGVRLLAGWWADARRADGLGGVAVLLTVGIVGLIALTGTGTAVLTAAAMLAFGAGWGWNGLFNFAVVKHFPSSPARATSVALTGTYIGAALGPLALGQIVDAYSYDVAWLVAATFSGIASLAILSARSQLTRMRESGTSGADEVAV